MSRLEWYRGVVYDIIKETPGIRRFFIEFPELETFNYRAGQYVKLELPIPAKKNYRQYSIACAPNGSNRIELLIALDPNGLGTPYLFNEVNIGSELKVSRAMGNFNLPEAIETDLCFICTGVGLAPLRSMYLDLIKRNQAHQKIYLIFGTRFMADMCYMDEMQELAGLDYFNFIPVLSRELSPDWNGKRGYVHDIYMELFGDKKPAKFFICGWRDMVSQARTTLMSIGYHRRDIHFERYN